jgi:uncharacterized protein (DUF362 family)
MMDRISRRDFLIKTGKLSLACAGLGLFSAPGILKAAKETGVAVPDLAVARGDDPSLNTMEAIKVLGGIERFVKKGDKVVVKPNPITPSGPEVAANTNPFVVETVVRLCMEAGASEVVVVSHDAQRNFEGNGIMEAATRAGARVVAAMNRDLYRSLPVLRGKILHDVEIIEEILDANVFINIPIVKHHAGAIVTLSMKNLMGINWDRRFFHQNGLQQCIADMNTVVKTDLIVMDANRILLTNGPSGPGQTRDEKAVIAGTDPVAIDAYGTTLLGRDPNDIGHIRYAHELGVGEMDLSKISVKELSLN